MTSDCLPPRPDDIRLPPSSGVMLSGGQRARVALARALYAEPDSLYLEDIFAAVDQPTAATLWGTLCELHAFGVTIVLATNQARSGPLMAPDDDD